MEVYQKIIAESDSVNDDFIYLSLISVEQNEFTEADTIIGEYETSKALIEIKAPVKGYVNWLVNEGEEIKLGDTIAEIHDSLDTINKSEAKTRNDENFVKPMDEKLDKKSSLKTDQDLVTRALTKKQISSDKIISLEAEKLILDNNIDKNQISETIITSKLIKEKYTSYLIKNSIKSQVEVATKSKISRTKENEIKFLSNINSTGLTSRLSISIPFLKDNLIQYQNFIQSTPLPIIIFEISRLLKKYPNINNYTDGTSIISNEEVSIGVAFDNGINGLKVFVIRNCDRKNLLEIEKALEELSEKYNHNKFNASDLEGATFTVTDLYQYNINTFHPLVNYKNCGILGICGDDKKLNLDLTFDHRVTNGREIALLLGDLRDRIESRNTLNFKETNRNLSCVKCRVRKGDDTDLIFVQVASSDNPLNSYICNRCLNGW